VETFVQLVERRAWGFEVGEDDTLAIEAIHVVGGDKRAAHGAVLEALTAVL
jgi:hypothetical protein